MSVTLRTDYPVRTLNMGVDEYLGVTTRPQL